MTELTDAIGAMLAAGNLSGSIPGGCHFQNAPDGTATPYLIFDVLSPSGEPDYTKKGAPYDARVSFSVIGGNSRVVLLALQAAMAVIDAAGTNTGLLTLTGSAKNHNTLRDLPPTPMENSGDVRDENGERLYGWTTVYLYSVA